MDPDSQHKLCMLSNTPCSHCCCCFFGSLFSLFLPPTVLIPHASFLQSFLFYIFLLFSVNPSTSLLVILSNHLSSTPSFTSLWLHFLSFLTFHPNSIPFTLFTPFIAIFLTLLSPRPSFSYIISFFIQPALRATCTPSFPDPEKIADPTDAILSLSCILILLFPTMESWQPQRET